MIADPPRVRRSMIPYLGVLLALTAAPALAASGAPKTFASPDEAGAALYAAVKADDLKAMLAVLGQKALPLLKSGDTVADQQAREHFLAEYDEAHGIVAGNDGQSVLQVGTDEWPFPIPLVKADAGWHFDAAAGAEEILSRRIGKNELSVIQASLAYVDAQREYYDRNPEKSPLLHYAGRIASAPGTRDGLYWDTTGDEEPSPLGPGFAHARAQGYKGKSGVQEAFHGYYFRILTAQGPAAPGGAYDYLAKGKMLGGFALIAYPAIWDNSGVMTFIVNQDGVIYQKDLGPDTATKANAISTFNPDDTWQRVEPETPATQAAS